MRRSMLLLAVLAVVAVVLAYRLATRSRVVPQTAWVYTVVAPIAPGQPLAAGAVQRTRLNPDVIPQGALVQLQPVIGKPVYRDKKVGEVLVAADFQEPKLWLVDAIPEGRVSVSLRCPGTAVPYKEIKKGDRLDILVTRKDGRAFIAAHDAYFLGYVGGAPVVEAAPSTDTARVAAVKLATAPQAAKVDPSIQLILAVRPEDVFPLSEGVVTAAVIVHGAAETSKQALLTISPPARSRTVDVLAGSRREAVAVP